MIPFANVPALISHLRTESQKGERFATRFMFVAGRQAWDDLLPALKTEVDRVVYLSDFCSGEDVFPDMNRLVSYLMEEKTAGQSILLLPLAECIRLDPENGEIISLLAEWQTPRPNRLYVPLLAAEELVIPALRRVGRFQEGLLPEPWSLAGAGSSEVIAAPFSSNFAGCKVAKGMKEYLAMWEQNSVRKLWVESELVKWLPVQQSQSGCFVRLYPSAFSYVQQSIGWEALLEEWGSPKQWEWLASQIQEGDNLDKLASRILNVAAYQADQLFSLWGGLSVEERWLVWLWSKARCPSATYLYDVMRLSSQVDDLLHNVVMTIFNRPRSVQISIERKKLLQDLGVKLLPSQFWDRYHTLTDPLDKIAVLTDLSEEERVEMVKCVGELIVQGVTSYGEFLEASFPALGWYLQPDMTNDDYADRYFQVYNRCRIKDQVDEDLESLIQVWANEQRLWQYPSRSQCLAELRAQGAKVIWVDAMGLEWIGLLTQYVLFHSDQLQYEVLVARGNLPSKTIDNKEWTEDEFIERGLDDIAHHYAYQYPHSFLKSLEVIESIARKAFALLQQHSVVVITSDHGLSRFAATCKTKIAAPASAVVEAFGRYAILQNGAAIHGQQDLWIEDKGKAVLLTHNRFRDGSSCHGETHGGATPEECLVPVIVFRAAENFQMPRFEVLHSQVKLSAKGVGLLRLRLSRQVGRVMLRLGNERYLGERGAEFIWSFNLKGLKTGQYQAKVYVDQFYAGEVSFEVTKGLIQDDLGL